MKIHCAYDKLVPIEEIKEHPKNFNKHSREQIQRFAKILEYQGIRRPVRVSKLSGYIVSGHGLYLAIKNLGTKHVPVNFQDYENQEQELSDLIADNGLQAWSSLDLSAINLELSALGPDFDIEMLGVKDFKLEPAEKLSRACPQCGYVKLRSDGKQS